MHSPLPPSELQTQILSCETRILEAFKNKDLEVLDEMIHDDALFVLPNGLSVTKAGVIESYRTGSTAMTDIIGSDQIIHIIDDTAVVSFNMTLVGKYGDQVVNARFRYMRVWKYINNQWKAIAVSGVPLAG